MKEKLDILLREMGKRLVYLEERRAVEYNHNYDQKLFELLEARKDELEKWEQKVQDIRNEVGCAPLPELK